MLLLQRHGVCLLLCHQHLQFHHSPHLESPLAPAWQLQLLHFPVGPSAVQTLVLRADFSNGPELYLHWHHYTSTCYYYYYYYYCSSGNG